MKSINTILFALDISEASEYSFDYAAELADKYNARIVVIHVVHHQTDLRDYYVPHIAFDDIDRQIEAGAEKRTERFCEKHRKRFPDIEYSVEVGEPDEKIVEKAQEINASMIVMGTHGRTGFEHFIFGSTAEGVIRTAPCPVLTVRPSRDTKKQS